MNQEKRQVNQNSDSESLTRPVAWSVIGHIALVICLTIKTYFTPEETLDFAPAVRVDIVSLPNKLPQKMLPYESLPEPPKEKEAPPPPPIQPKFESKAEPKAPAIDKDAVDLTKIREKQAEALRKLRAQEAIEKLKKLAQTETKTQKQGSEKRRLIEGDEIRAGTALTGLNRLQHDEYVSALEPHIKQHWSLPEWLARKGLQATVQLRIDARGLLLDKRIVKSSGRAEYDEAALDTIDKANPFPAPPQKFISLMETTGVLIHFP